MMGPFGKQLNSNLNRLVYTYLTLIYFVDLSFGWFLLRVLVHTMQKALVKSQSLRFSAISIIIINLCIMVSRLLASDGDVLILDFFGKISQNGELIH